MEAEGRRGITAPRGFVAGAAACGIKKEGLDVCWICSERRAVAAGVFTTNKVKAAPVIISQENLSDGHAYAIVVNSGNANACTGEQGLADVRALSWHVKGTGGMWPTDILWASTGVIGVPWPRDKVGQGISKIELTPDGGADAASAIMTTDTFPKETVLRLELAGKTVTIGGMAKGAGMIHPNMATMLAFVTTDAAVEVDYLRAAIQEAAENSFNMISVDGDTSTNDTFLVLANGAAGNTPIRIGSPGAAVFQAGLNEVATRLAKMIARDGEGATKLIEVRVRGAANRNDARLVARAVVRSNLVKAAVYGNDPNWGRILCAAGYSGAEVDQNAADIAIGNAELMRGGRILPFDKAIASGELNKPEVVLHVDMHLGDGEAVAWGCDLTEEYVVVNSKYTT